MASVPGSVIRVDEQELRPGVLEDVADLVVEMTKVKHPMDAGQKGQRGIEW